MKAQEEISITKTVKASDNQNEGQAAPRTVKDEKEYRELLKECIIRQWETFKYYRNLSKAKGLNLEDLKKAIDNEEYYILPGVASDAFKKSRGLVTDLNDLTLPGKFQVSSSTSGDPSYIYTSHSELEKILNNYIMTFGIKGISRGIGFGPSIRIIDSLSRKAKYLNKKSVARMKFALEATKLHYSEIVFTVDIYVLRTIFSMLVRKKPVLKKLTLEQVTEIIGDAEKNNEKFAIGGVALLMVPYFDQLKEGQFKFHNNMNFILSGGGYSGKKGTFRGKRINKPELIKKISAVFGIDEKYYHTNIKDIYGFTENPTTHEGYWNNDIGDFMFQPWHDSRMYIVDPETEKPLKQGKGLVKIITPYSDGKPSAANVSVTQFDLAKIFGVKENYQITHFSHISRFSSLSIEGCGFKAGEITRQ
jgi:hypothetical protein